MNQWQSKPDEPPLFGIDRSRPSDFFTRALRKRSLWWRIKARIVRWLGGELE